MDIKTSSINQSSEVNTSAKATSGNNSDVNFKDELNELQKTQDINKESEESVNNTNVSTDDAVENLNTEENEFNKLGSVENINVLAVKPHKPEIAVDNLELVINKLSQSDDKNELQLKNLLENDDNIAEDINLINNDYNIDNKEVLPQMSFNMNFEGNNQSFSSLMKDNGEKLASSAKDLAEEAAILSTMAENIAMANKADIESKTAILHKNDGIKRVNTDTNIVQATIVEYDTVIVSEQDADFFANLVNNKEINYINSDSQSVQKAFHVSKSLADLLVKSMEENKPVRIEFDNGISVIIKITRDGKLSADFLPSTQVAEAYLRENLPILKQRLSEQNLDYDELNQRERQSRDREENRKKGRENE